MMESSISEEILETRARELATPLEDRGDQSAVTSLLRIRISDAWYGIVAEQVKEVVIEPRLTRIPLTPPFVAGVVNLRGELLPVIDFSLLLNGRPSESSFVVACQAIDSFNFGLLASEVDSVQGLAASVRSEVLSTRPTVTRRYFAATFRLDSGPLAVLDLEGIAQHPDLQSMRSPER